jgi:hypothetical protein
MSYLTTYEDGVPRILVSCVLCLVCSISVENPLQIRPKYAKQTQFARYSNDPKFC